MKRKTGNTTDILEYTALIQRIRNGDHRAMGLLITRFQDVAAGIAYSWLKDPELAREVAQEAFLDAYINLHQLNDPVAFPAWFRQVVVKHCDRVTRRRSPDSAAMPLGTDDVSPESVTADEQERAQLRLAVAALPATQRQVIALQYFAELTGPEIADFLQLPLSTVKKRLRLARRSLHDHSEKLMKDTLQAMRPSNTKQFSEEIQFFIAMRENNLATVINMLELRPALANVQQDWDSSIVYQRVLPFASRATALITAIELDSLPLARALLKAGADANGLCGCATGEPPLWAATLLNRADHVDLLLEHGAEPNAWSASGNTPLHIAAMRGYKDIAQRLLEAGANPDALDADTVPEMPLVAGPMRMKTRRTPGEWASLNHNAETANSLAMRIVDGTSGKLLETGIKAVDFFAPIPLGGLVRINFAAGVGMLLLISEMIWRFSRMQDSAVIWTGFAQPPFDRRQFESEMYEFGIADKTVPFIADFSESSDIRRAAFADGLKNIRRMASERHVLAVVLSTEGFENEIDAGLPQLKLATGDGSITSLVVTPFRREPPPAKLTAPYDVDITFDRRRALKRLYPSIHPAHTFSNAIFTNDQARLRDAANALFESHEGKDKSLDEYKTNSLFEFFCQAFKVVEPFGGDAAERIPVDDTLRAVEALFYASGGPGR